jgi:hypothetical protein
MLGIAYLTLYAKRCEVCTVANNMVDGHNVMTAVDMKLYMMLCGQTAISTVNLLAPEFGI